MVSISKFQKISDLSKSDLLKRANELLEKHEKLGKELHKEKNDILRRKKL